MSNSPKDMIEEKENAVPVSDEEVETKSASPADDSEEGGGGSEDKSPNTGG
ncbi:MAG: hypothetical protein AB7U82_29160 [Blastocatellales bacterium]